MLGKLLRGIQGFTGRTGARQPRRTGVPRLLRIGFALVMLLGLLPQIALAAPIDPRVEANLLATSQANPNAIYRVIVLRNDRGHAADDYLSSKGYPKLKEFASVGFVANVRGRDIADLGRFPAIKRVSIDAPMVASDSTCSAPLGSCDLGTLYPQAVSAAAGWTTTGGASAQWTGAGIGVAVIDTGIAPAPDFNSSASGPSRVVASQFFNANTTTASDGFGHGSHVAGIIGGNSWWNPNAAVQGKYVGVAPQVNLIDLKAADDTGASYTSDVANAIEWAISNRQTYNIRVINLSMVSSTAESYLTSALDAEVEKAWFNGIVVVISAGNAGANSELYPPANDPFVITVGAADPMNTAAQSDDTIAYWSSYGTTQDGFSKPDVVAPGRYVTSVLASSTAGIVKEFPNNVVDGTYITLSGTSMAAPVVSGVAALIAQAHPTWSNDQIKWVLENTAVRLSSGGSPLAGSGNGEVNVASAIAYASTPSFANQGVAINTYLAGPNGATTYNNTDPLTNSTSSWSTSSWSTSSWSTSSWSTSSWSTSSWSTSSWSSLPGNH